MVEYEVSKGMHLPLERGWRRRSTHIPEVTHYVTYKTDPIFSIAVMHPKPLYLTKPYFVTKDLTLWEKKSNEIYISTKVWSNFQLKVLLFLTVLMRFFFVVYYTFTQCAHNVSISLSSNVPGCSVSNLHLHQFQVKRPPPQFPSFVSQAWVISRKAILHAVNIYQKWWYVENLDPTLMSWAPPLFPSMIFKCWYHYWL